MIGTESNWVGEFIYLQNGTQNGTTVKVRELVERLTKNEFLTDVPKIMLLDVSFRFL